VPVTVITLSCFGEPIFSAVQALHMESNWRATP